MDSYFCTVVFRTAYGNLRNSHSEMQYKMAGKLRSAYQHAWRYGICGGNYAVILTKMKPGIGAELKNWNRR